MQYNGDQSPEAEKKSFKWIFIFHDHVFFARRFDRGFNFIKRKGFLYDFSFQDEVFFQFNELTEYVILPDLGLFSI